MDEHTDRPEPLPTGIRASDAEREEVATRLREAAAEGRLDLTETEQRLATAYAARRRHQLTALVADLPAPEPQPPAHRGAPRRLDGWDRTALGVHAALVVALAVAVLTRWSTVADPHPWPIFPIFWAVLSLAVHARLRRRGRWGRVEPR